MINYKTAKARSLEGDYPATIVAVEVEPNNYYDPKNENSTENTLSITFQLEDPVTGDPIMHTQKYIAPLTGGKGLFQQLFDLLGFPPDADGGGFDEQEFVDLQCIVTMGKNKKDYNAVMAIKKADDKIEDQPL